MKQFLSETVMRARAIKWRIEEHVGQIMVVCACICIYDREPTTAQ